MCVCVCVCVMTATLIYPAVKRLRTEEPVMDIEDLVMAGTRQRLTITLSYSLSNAMCNATIGCSIRSCTSCLTCGSMIYIICPCTGCVPIILPVS